MNIILLAAKAARACKRASWNFGERTKRELAAYGMLGRGFAQGVCQSGDVRIFPFGDEV